MTTSSGFARNWTLDPEIVFLNHGSFGAAPRLVLERQGELRGRLEAEPVRFFLREYPELLAEAREKLATFVNADPAGLAFVTNATTGVNAVLRSLTFKPGDEVLSSGHGYPACRFAARDIAEAVGAHAIEARIPMPVEGRDEVIELVISRMGDRTRLLVIDHVTSPTAIILPIEPIIREAHQRGISVLVDGAHAPGMLDLDLEALGADFYIGNCHKWLCSPKGAGFLWVAEAYRDRVRPTVLSHAAGPGPRPERFREEFDWTGTADHTAWLCVPEAIRVMAEMVPGGWPEIRRRNRELVLSGRRLLADLEGVEAICPESMIGSMASVVLPATGSDEKGAFGLDPLQATLFDEEGIEAQVMGPPQWPERLLRISAQLYNSIDQFERLARALGRLL
jgi:isopenicillin-N epimerase